MALENNYYEAQLAHEMEVRAQERILARRTIEQSAPPAERELFLDALGLLEA